MPLPPRGLRHSRGVSSWGVALAALTAAWVAAGLPVAGRLQGPQAVPVPKTGTGLILGRVVDGDSNTPIAGAIVDIHVPMTVPQGARAQPQPAPDSPAFNNGQPAASMMTDADGWFAFRDLPAGTITLQAELTGYTGGGNNQRQPDGPAQPLALTDGQQLGDVTLRMWKLATITGVVTDESGEPVIGAFVRVLRRHVVGGQPVITMSGAGNSTDDRGVYRSSGVIPGDYLLSVPSVPTTVPIAALVAAANPANAVVGPAGNVLALNAPGVVMNGSGEQVGNLVLETGRSAVAPAASETGPIYVYPTIFYPSAASSSKATVVKLKSGENRTNVDIQLPLLPGLRVSGTVTGATGPAGGVGLHLTVTDPDAGYADSSPDDAAQAVTDPQGQFTFLGVPRGQYVLHGTTMAPLQMLEMPNGAMAATRGAGSTAWASMPVVVDQTNVTGLTVALQPGIQVSGHVVFEGNAAQPTAQQLQRPGVRLTNNQAGAGGRLGGGAGMQAQIAADGSFTTTGLIPGRYSVVAPSWPVLKWIVKSISLSGTDISDVPLEITGADLTNLTVTYTDQPVHLAGTVRDPASGRADGTATVVLFPSDRRAWGWQGGLHTRSAHASANGTFSFSSLPPGDYQLAAVPDGWQNSLDDPTVLERLMPFATRLQLREGDTHTEDLKTAAIR